MREITSRLRTVLLVVFALLFAGSALYFVYKEFSLERPEKIEITTSGRVDMCLFCHTKERLDPAHDATVIGCASCHLGDPLAIDKDKAHTGIVNNPGDLRVVRKTCGVEGCHPTDVKKVVNSLMATNRGILGTLLYYWGESDSQDTELTVKDLIDSGETSLALDYFRKLCGTCHLWKQKNDLPGAATFFNEKGGGCSACHFESVQGFERAPVTQSDDRIEEEDPEKEFMHPLVTRTVEDDNCIRCHNRSGRIGLAYVGVFESEGYGTPYEKGGLSSRRMPGDRFYLELADDIHHRRGMSCIDCHTRDEIMGDGTSYAHYEEQLEISCEVCHSSDPGTTRKGNELINLVYTEDNYQLVGKNNQKKYDLKVPRQGVCDFKQHSRVTCEACHSTWVPQCYGCHAKRDKSKTHLDKLSLQETPGRWEEGRSYIRYRKPMLAIWKDEVVVVTPGCQDIVSLIDASGNLEGSFNRFTMAAINPHTTQEKGRECVDCHVSTKTVGLGEGTLGIEDGQVFFRPLNKGVDTHSGTTVGFDTFVTLDGTPLQFGSRPDLRPFNGAELSNILRVGLCVECHNSYDDPIWETYNAEMVCPRRDADHTMAQARWPGNSGQPALDNAREE
jgi:hypothetical protein